MGERARRSAPALMAAPITGATQAAMHAKASKASA
jgi:hypothetical protein